MSIFSKVILVVLGVLLFTAGLWLGEIVGTRNTRRADRACIVSFRMGYTRADTLEILFWYKGGRPECVHWIPSSGTK